MSYFGGGGEGRLGFSPGKGFFRGYIRRPRSQRTGSRIGIFVTVKERANQNKSNQATPPLSHHPHPLFSLEIAHMQPLSALKSKFVRQSGGGD